MSQIDLSQLTASESSKISGNLVAFVNDDGAGSIANITATSQTGETSSSSKQVFTNGATSSSATAIASIVPGESPLTNVTANAPAQIDPKLSKKRKKLSKDIAIEEDGPDELTGKDSSNLFSVGVETSDPLLAEVNTLNAAEGDLTAVLTNKLEAFALKGNGSTNALVKLPPDPNASSLGVISDTVDIQGMSTLTVSNFSYLSVSVLD